MDREQIPPGIADRALRLKLVLTDCDGVLTDGGVYYSATGEELKRFDIRDGMGVERLRNLAGIETGIVTGENSPSVVQRAQKLGIAECHLGCKDKAATVLAILERRKLRAEEVAYLGDDVNDLPAFTIVGLTSCPGDAFDEVKTAADLVLENPGGHGAFREFAEIVLQARAGAE
jgi:3-deoxy-D-manno-octulosonate 8-phosphate phosphatase (KDO 8-P phosphatase)